MSSTNDQQGPAQMENHIQVHIDGRGLPAESSSWPKIFRVPHYFRKLNEEAYEPKLISIGPYHHGKEHLKAMETNKVRFQKDLLQRSNENTAQRYLDVMTGMLERARKCYSESLVISNEDFSKMMALDGCFVVELICKFKEESFNDSILKVGQIRSTLLADLILVENQLPFFVLWKFLGVAVENRSPYIAAINKMFVAMMPGLRVRETFNENSRHLLDVLRFNWLPSEDPMPENGNMQDIEYIRSATELTDSGIEFRKWKGRNLFDMKFKNATFYIPAVSLEDHTEGLYCNIIACEQFDDDGSPKYLTEYITVMDCLIGAGKDVELLCDEGIMPHRLATGEAAAKIFNRLGTQVIMDKNNFFYAKLFNDINRYYYHATWNRRMAILRRSYFSSPWVLLSFYNAVFLLLLAILQTTYTIVPRS